MSTTIALNSHGGKRYISLGITALLLVIGAIWSAKLAGTSKDLRMRKELARQAIAVAAAIPVEEARALSFTPDDLKRPQYTRLCSMLKAWSDLSGLNSIYTMALRNDGKLVFGPKTLEPDSPGDIYLEPDERDFLPFETGEPVVIGPYTDKFGSFVSAAAPVVHPRSGNVLFTVGIDIEAAEWEAEIRRAQWVSLLVVLSPLAVLFIGGVVIKRRSKTSPANARRLHHTEATVCAVVSLMLTLIATLFVSREERIRRRDTFYSAAHFKAEVHAEQLYDTAENLRLLATFFESSEEVTAEEFRTVCAPILRRRAIAGCAWCPEVATEEQAAFETGVRAAGHAGFSIRPLPDAMPDETRTRLYPALYVEPAETAEEAIGYNLASEPVRRVALTEALQTGRITATDPIRLAALPDGPPGIFLLCPVNASSQKGVLAMAFRPEKLMQSLAHQIGGESAETRTCLLQMEPGSPPQTLFCPVGQTAAACAAEVPEELRTTFPIFVFGKPYALLLTPTQKWLADNPLSHTGTTLVAGLLLSGLLTALVSILANRRRLLEERIYERTAELRASEERTDIATRAAGIGIWDRDVVNNRLSWDDRMYQLYGIDKKDFAGAYEAWQQCLHPDDLERAVAEVAAAEEGKKEFDTEFRIVRPDGETRHIRAFAKVIRDADGKPLRMAGTNQDITDRKRSEERIAASEAKFRSYIDDAPFGIFVSDRSGRYREVNPAAESITGYSRDELLSMSIPDLLPENQQEAGLQHFRTLLETGRTDGKTVFRTKAGEIRWWSISAVKLSDDRYLGFTEDITETQKHREALQQSEERFNKMLGVVPDMISIHSSDMDILYSNWQGFGAVPEGRRKTGTKCYKTYRGLENICPDCLAQEVLQTKKSLQKEVQLPDGSWFDLRVIPLVSKNNRVEMFMEWVRDITDRKEAEQKLKESEEKLRGIIENSTNLFYSHTPDHVLTYLSPQVKDILGYEVEEALQRWTEMATGHPINEQGFELTEKAIRTGKPQPTYELQLRHKDGHPVWVEVHEAPAVEDGKTVAIVGSLTDITARKEAEEQLRESKEFLQSTIDGLSAHIALLNEEGTILLVNKAWRNFAEQNGLDPEQSCEGSNYLAACESATGSCSEDAADFATGLREVLTGHRDSFRLEYPCKTETRDYWFAANVSRFDQTDSRRAVVFHTDITDAKVAETALKQKMKELARFNKAAVGRELRMIELKKEINALCRGLGKPPAYPLHPQDTDTENRS